MVKTSQPFELSQRFALQDTDRFKRRFALRVKKLKPAALSRTTSLTNTLSILQNEWQMEFLKDSGSSPHPVGYDHVDCKKALTDIVPLTETNSNAHFEMLSTNTSCTYDFIENVSVPQDYWDDLFDKALVVLNTADVCVDEDLYQHQSEVSARS